ncbi:hypothetical protein L1049_021270 [Liquidambar formosana]|uniref:Uncharacterized protein n=1 Tax=Liquidambar formosana TaxID=63359 RepID=A0AAP0SB64_LIQFO
MPPPTPQTFPRFPSLSFTFPPFLLSLSLLLLLTLSSSTPTPTPTPPPSFYSILRSHGLPIGLIPKSITNFTMDPTTGRFEVHLDRACNAKFENQVHYDFNVTGTLSFGQIGELFGVSAQELFLWFPVKNIRVDVPSSGLIYFDVGGVVSKQFSLSLFETPPDCVDVGPTEDARILDSLLEIESQSGKLKRVLDERDVLRAVS